MKQNWLRKRAGLLSFIAVLLFVLVPSAFAFDGREGQKVVIGAEEVIEDDLYVGADQFILNGTVKGDVYFGGTRIEMNGIIEGDLMAAGQSIVINGTVHDDVRVAGMAVTLGEKAVLNDGLLFAGYSLETERGSTIEQDVMFLGAQALIAGDIAENLTVFGDGLTLFGTVGGDVFADVGSGEDLPPVSPFMFVPNAPSIPTIEGGLTVGEAAFIGGDLNYTVASHVNIPVGIVDGEVVETVRVATEGAEVVEPVNIYTAWVATQLRYLVTLLLIGGLLLWLVPKTIERIGRPIETTPLPSLGWGFVSLIAFMVGFVAILAITILIAIGFSTITLGNLAGLTIAIGLFVFAGLGIIFGLIVAYLTKIAVGYIGGRMILERWIPTWADNRFVALGLGLLLLVFLTSVPYIGGWINFAVILLGLGALWLIGHGMYRQRYGQSASADEPKGTIQPA